MGSPLEEIPHKKKKKDKKKKDRKRSLSPEGISNTSLPSNGSSRLHEEQALSESELVSKRAALLAQLNEQIDWRKRIILSAKNEIMQEEDEDERSSD